MATPRCPIPHTFQLDRAEPQQHRDPPGPQAADVIQSTLSDCNYDAANSQHHLGS